MVNEIKRLAELQNLTSAKYAAAQARYGRLRHKEARLRENLAQLIEDRDRATRAMNGAPIAQTGLNNFRWHRWVDRRRGAINMELAAIVAQRLELKQALQSAFGKDQALKAVIKKQSAHALRGISKD